MLPYTIMHPIRGLPAWTAASLALVLVAVPPRGLVAQVPVDSTLVILDSITITRTPAPLLRVPQAASTVDAARAMRSRPGLGADELLPLLPGVIVANRYNPSLDQRIMIRGAGARATFGVRGVTILLDGVPQTLPDGQTQLNNVDWGLLGEAEVLRGGTGGLYGNAAGGVINLSTRRPAGATDAALRTIHGSDDLWRSQLFIGTRGARGEATLGASRTTIRGFRQHSRAETTQWQATGRWEASPRVSLRGLVALVEAPRANNPGALTAAELAVNRDSAAARNISTDAGKDVAQQQAAVTLAWTDARETAAALTVFGLHRDLANPLPIDVLVGIERIVGGIRLSGHRVLGDGAVMGGGVDWQRQRDDRTNHASAEGVPTDSLLVDQRETTSTLGAFATLSLHPWRSVRTDAALRYDRTTFGVTDHLLTDGDDSGERLLDAVSASLGASVEVTPAFVPWIRAGTSFETPTTTELANQPDGAGGFNPDLGPERSVTWEAGARGRPLPWLRYEATGYLGRTRDALVPFEESGGRAYFTNAGRLHADGVELGLTATRQHWRAHVSYAWSHARFAIYRLTTGAVVDTLDGKALPGVPAHALTVDLTLHPTGGVAVGLTHAMQSGVPADDDNTLASDGWGAGITGLRASWRVEAGGLTVVPMAGIHNLFDRTYVASIAPNGFGGRVFEPGPGRTVWVGMEVGYLRSSE